MEKDIIEKAKYYAQAKGSSLSKLVENYLHLITTHNSKSEIEITPLVKSMKGVFNSQPDIDYKKELNKILKDKYL